MKKDSPKKRCPKGTRRDPKTKQCIKKSSPIQNKKNTKKTKKTKKTITYGFDGGLTKTTLHFPKVELSTILSTRIDISCLTFLFNSGIFSMSYNTSSILILLKPLFL